MRVHVATMPRARTPCRRADVVLGLRRRSQKVGVTAGLAAVTVGSVVSLNVCRLGEPGTLTCKDVGV